MLGSVDGWRREDLTSTTRRWQFPIHRRVSSHFLLACFAFPQTDLVNIKRCLETSHIGCGLSQFITQASYLLSLFFGQALFLLVVLNTLNTCLELPKTNVMGSGVQSLLIPGLQPGLLGSDETLTSGRLLSTSVLMLGLFSFKFLDVHIPNNKNFGQINFSKIL